MMICAPSPLSPARRSGTAFGLARLCGAVMLGAVVLGATMAAAASPALAQSSVKTGGAGGSSGSKSDSFCASYGAGFQRVPGTDSCMKTGAVVRTDAYSGSSVSNAPNQFNNSTSSSLPATAAPATDPWKSSR